MNEVKQKHHIIPKHVGGTNDPSNLVELTIEEHSEAHRKLYEEHGRWQDYLAWKSLGGLIGREEMMSQVISHAQKELVASGFTCNEGNAIRHHFDNCKKKGFQE